MEAYPPSLSVTCLTVDLLLEPGGEVSVLSCGDQLHGACRLETLGSCVPQASVRPAALHALCSRVGRACLQRRILGHVSVDLATFLDPRTAEQKVRRGRGVCEFSLKPPPVRPSVRGLHSAVRGQGDQFLGTLWDYIFLS